MSDQFPKANRLKVGTFKVLSTGFRLGERFIKIILDNAVLRKAKEVYVTMFEKREELEALKSLFLLWGFVMRGTKKSTGEIVLVKSMDTYASSQSPRFNYPLLPPTLSFAFLPIEQQFHTDLFPDSKLANENLVDFIQNKPYRYAIQKIYITWAPTKQTKKGDLVFIYRKGNPGNAKHTGVVTTLCIVDGVIRPDSEKALLEICSNRSVFTSKQLSEFWKKSGCSLSIIKLLYYKTLDQKVVLGDLWDNDIVPAPFGPRPFDPIDEPNALKILDLAHTSL